MSLLSRQDSEADFHNNHRSAEGSQANLGGLLQALSVVCVLNFTSKAKGFELNMTLRLSSFLF